MAAATLVCVTAPAPISTLAYLKAWAATGDVKFVQHAEAQTCIDHDEVMHGARQFLVLLGLDSSRRTAVLAMEGNTGPGDDPAEAAVFASGLKLSVVVRGSQGATDFLLGAALVLQLARLPVGKPVTDVAPPEDAPPLVPGLRWGACLASGAATLALACVEVSSVLPAPCSLLHACLTQLPRLLTPPNGSWSRLPPSVSCFPERYLVNVGTVLRVADGLMGVAGLPQATVAQVAEVVLAPFVVPLGSVSASKGDAHPALVDLVLLVVDVIKDRLQYFESVVCIVAAFRKDASGFALDLLAACKPELAKAVFAADMSVGQLIDAARVAGVRFPPVYHPRKLAPHESMAPPIGSK
jgi:hypothetical protein